MKRTLVIAAIAFGAALIPAQTAAAHGGAGTDLTSDFRTTITEVPDIDGLTARTVGLDGSIEIIWTGDGTLIVDGYQGEPYLRFDDSGVAMNMRSPAAYLNNDRYANVAVPSVADAAAEPDWQLVSAGNRRQWHDHRTHWMSSELPTQVRDEPGNTHVVYDRWEVPISVNGTAAVIAGDLMWAPPPTLWPWLAIAAAIAVIACCLLWSAIWRPAAAVLAAIGTIALMADTVGFVAELHANLANQIWAFNFAIVVALAAIRLAIHATRRTPHPTLAMMVAGIVLTVIAGYDRFDVLTSGFYQSALNTTAARVATVTCLGIGVALSARFLAFLIPLLVNPSVPAATGAESTSDVSA